MRRLSPDQHIFQIQWLEEQKKKDTHGGIPGELALLAAREIFEQKLELLITPGVDKVPELLMKK